MEPHEAIKTIIQQYGPEIISEIRFANILSDMGTFRQCPPINNILKVLISKGYMTQIRTIQNDKQKKTFSLNAADTLGLNGSQIEYITDCILYGLGEKTDIPNLPNILSPDKEDIRNNASPKNNTTPKKNKKKKHLIISLIACGILALTAALILSGSNKQFLYRVQENGLYGYVDSLGHVIIKPQYKYASSFSEDGYALIISNAHLIKYDSSSRNKKNVEEDDLLDTLSITYGYINNKNILVVDTTNVIKKPFIELERYWDLNMPPEVFVDKFNSGSLPFRSEIFSELGLNEGKYLFQDSKTLLLGYKNIKDEIVIKPKYEYGKSFYKDRTFVAIPFDSLVLKSNSNVNYMMNSFKLIDSTDNLVVDNAWFKVAPFNKEGLTWVSVAAVDPTDKFSQDWQQIDLNGKTMIGPIPGERSSIYNNYNSEKLYIYHFLIYDYSFYSFIDDNGRWITDTNHDNELSISLTEDGITEVYTDVCPFSEGLAAVKLFNKTKERAVWTFIDKDLNHKLGEYDSIITFSEGLSGVQEFNEIYPHYGNWGYIDKNSDVIIPYKFSEVGRFKHGLAYAKISGSTYDLEGLINKKGEFVWSCNRKKE